MEVPELTGEAGWTPLERFNERRTAESYVSGEPDGRRLRIRYFRREEDGALTGRVWFGPGCQGPPGHVHGGAIAALLDEAMGFSAWIAGHRVVAASVRVEFRAMVPLGSVATLVSEAGEPEGRKVRPRARLELASGRVAAESEGLFLVLERHQLDALAGHAAAAGMDPEAFA